MTPEEHVLIKVVALEAEIRSLQASIPTYCKRCTQEIPRYWPFSDSTNLDKALHVRVTGSYGEFIDVMDRDSSLDFSFCHDCAHDFIKFIGPAGEHINGHSH
jgi:hypothetical protein